MIEEVIFHINANWELFKQFWWVYLIIFIICSSVILVAFIFRENSQQSNSTYPYAPARENPAYWFILSLISFVCATWLYLALPKGIEAGEYYYLVIRLLYFLGGKWLVVIFFVLNSIIFGILGFRKYQEKGKLYYPYKY